MPLHHYRPEVLKRTVFEIGPERTFTLGAGDGRGQPKIQRSVAMEIEKETGTGVPAMLSRVPSLRDGRVTLPV